MKFIKTLIHALCGLFRKPHALKNLAVFLTVIATLFILSFFVFSRMVENIFLSFCVRWVFVPLSVLFLVMRHSEAIKRRNYRNFFYDVNLLGYDDNPPEYLYSIPFNDYINIKRFRAKIPLKEWEKQVDNIEIFHNKKIYKIENLEENMMLTDIYLIEENLPNFILWNDDYMVEGRAFVIGETYNGKAVWNAAELPHAIVAGGTGSGKTVILRSIIRQAILKNFNVNILDFKGGGDFSGVENEYRKYNDIEKGYGSMIISEPENARDLLIALKVEIESRASDYEKAGVANIDEFNKLSPSQGRHIPWLLVIDEAAEILDVNPKDKDEKALYNDINKTLRTLARKARSAGIHIVMGIIRPDANVLDGQIKNNLQFRICGYFADSPASRIVLENDKATELPPNIKGRFIVGDEECQAFYLPLPNEKNG